MQEINFIRPQEVYDRNTGESKVRYRSYDGNDRFIPVVDGEKGVPKTMVEVTHAELKAMRDNGKLTAGALYRITDYQCTTTQENTRSAGHQFDIVLLALSENKLAEEGWAMMNESNIYDVTFSDGVTLKCWIVMDGESSCNLVVASDTTTGLSNILINVGVDSEIFLNEETKTAISVYGTDEFIDISDLNIPYNYFQNSNLSAWKVWYCLDNDKSRFAWADDSVDEDVPASIEWVNWNETLLRFPNGDVVNDGTTYFAWKSEGSNYVNAYTLSEQPIVGTNAYEDGKNGLEQNGIITQFTPAHEGTGLPNGRGVIYRLIDEWNNDVGYDFKNVQFVRKLTDGQYDANGTETWCYTLNVWYNDMCQDASIVGNTLPNDEGYIDGVYGNNFGYATAHDIHINGVDTFAFALGNNVVLSFYDKDDGYYGIFSNTIGNAFYKNTIGSVFRNNMIGNNFTNNIIGSWFASNTIGNSFVNETISDNISFKNYGNNGVELATKDDLN